MRTTLDLDDDLMAALGERFPGISKTSAVESALRAFLADDTRRRIKALRGTIEIDPAWREMRERDRQL